MHALALNGRPRTALYHVGHEREPVLQVDGMCHRPEALVEYAAQEVRFAPAWGPDGGYPGLRAPAPLDYVEAVVRAYDPILREAFALGDVRLAGAECNFSLVTLSASELAPSQRVPHVDTTDGLQFALLQYLSASPMGGTALYRHCATGFETLTPQRMPIYEAARASEPEPAAGYIAGSTAEFEKTAVFEDAFDRMLVYRSRLLHSGHIAPDAQLSADPRQGRLTVNVFLTYRPA